MTSEDGRWDPATVLGLRSSDRVLVFGNPAFLPWLPPLFGESAPGELASVRKGAQADALLQEGRRFDKVILTRETPFTHEHLLRAAAFRAQLVVFPKSEGDAWAVEQSAEFYYPGARVSKFDSAFGPVVVASPFGASWRFIYA